MPRLVDYAGRYAFIREAAFAIVLDRDVAALTRRAVAAELGCGVNTVRRLVDPSASLAGLAADEVASRRRQGRFGGLPEEPLPAALVLVRRVLPDDESRIDEELVWLRLVAAGGLTPSGLERPGRMREEFFVAQHGYSQPGDGDDRDDRDDPQDTYELGEGLDLAGDESRDPAMDRHLAARETELDAILGRTLLVLGMSTEDRDERARLRALVDGVALGVCSARLTPAEGVDVMERHLGALDAGPARSAG